MDDSIANDNLDPYRPLAGVHEPAGHAALLLVESLLHGLIARGVLTVSDAVEIAEVATEVKQSIGEDMGDAPKTLTEALTLLRSISASLRPDIKA